MHFSSEVEMTDERIDYCFENDINFIIIFDPQNNALIAKLI